MRTHESESISIGLVTPPTDEEKGEINVAGAVNEPAGGGTELSTPPQQPMSPLVGTAGAESNGMVSTPANVGPTDAGETTKPLTGSTSWHYAAADVRKSRMMRVKRLGSA